MPNGTMLSNSKRRRRRADVDHNLFALLAEQMLEVNKQKPKEIYGFLD
jgi:hypothetical protein